MMKSNLTRLAAIAAAIKDCGCHGDIGSDHALLPLELLRSGRAQRVIAVEKHLGPWRRSLAQLAGQAGAEVRRGDGLDPLAPGEVDSLSISGMGCLNILAILQAHPQRLPDKIVLQAQDQCRPLRLWAWNQQFHLREEHWVKPHCILVLQRASGPDPAYSGLPQQAALYFGPHLLRLADDDLREQVIAQGRWLLSHGKTCEAWQEANAYLSCA